MSYVIKRQIEESEKRIVLEKYGRKCYATGHLIPEGEEIQFDHIKAFSAGGSSDVTNIAPMCPTHNKEKGALPLDDFRTKLKLTEFFLKDDKQTLHNLLEYFKEKGMIENFGQAISIESSNEEAIVTSPKTKNNVRILKCPLTGWEYFYANLDVSIIDSDEESDGTEGLQPRYLVPEKVFNMFRHFRTSPVLQPSIGRIFKNRIRIFDGQHKIAGLLWNNRKIFECKVYINPDIRLLNDTNIMAHNQLAQTKFFSTIMVLKLGGQFGDDFFHFKDNPNISKKSEQTFVDYLIKQKNQQRGQVNEKFRSYLINLVLEDENNKLAQFVSAGNRGTNEKPLTIDMLKKSLFSKLMLLEPAEEEIDSPNYLRQQEVHNLIFLMNVLFDGLLKGVDLSAEKDSHNIVPIMRIFSSKSMMAWSELVRDAISAKLNLRDQEDREKPLYRKLDDNGREAIKSVIAQLISWSRWNSPTDDEIDRNLIDNKTAVKEWFKKSGLTTGYLLGAVE